MGWIFIGIGFVLLNLYVYFHYRKIKYTSLILIFHVFFIFLTIFYFGFFFSSHVNTFIHMLSYGTGFFICTLFYIGLGYLLIDFFSFVFYLFTKKKIHLLLEIPVFLVACFLSIYGIMHAGKVYEVFDQVTIKGTGSKVRIAALSDFHIGVGVDKKKMKDIAMKLKKQNPNFVVILGDLFDEGTSFQSFQEVMSIFNDMNFDGIYYVSGNHEANSKNRDLFFSYMREKNITILDDESVLIGQQFYFLGRKDSHFKRKSLRSLLENKKGLPVVLLEHRPYDLEARNNSSISLQLSGHTHNGQIFPFQWFDFLPFFPSYGNYQVGDFKEIVTSGVGEWGIPVRLFSNAEIRYIDIFFE